MNRPDDFSSTRFPEPRSCEAHYLRFLSGLPEFRTSRRAVLVGLAGAGAGMPLAGALARAASRFQVRWEDGRLALVVGGLEAWVVDERWFDGAPQLAVRHDDSRLDVQLAHALFPGTTLEAGFHLVATQDGAGWTARLRIPALGFSAEFAFEPWLLGVERASARVGPRSLAFRQAADLGLDWRDGVLSIGPDWIIDLADLGGATLRFDQQQVAVSGLRCELACAARALPGPGPRLDLWPMLAGDGALRFPEAERTLVLSAAGTRGHIGATLQRTRLRMHGETGHALAWRAAGLADVRLPVRHAQVSLDYGASPRTLVAQAAPAGRSWHEDAGFAAEFGMDGGGAQPVLGASAAPAAPRAHRFVVSLPGCDAAMFTQRQPGPAQDPDTYGAGLFDFARRRIALDAYDLTLKRAADALALTVRFRQVRLLHTWRGWQLFSTGADSLVEFDFGSQHLLEEAVYISDWACLQLACAPVVEPALPEETVAAAILRYRWDAASFPGSPVSAAQLAPYKERDLARFLDWLHEHKREAFNAFRTLAAVREKLAASAPVSGKAPIRVEYARATHLSFGFHAPDGILLGVDNLLAWANPAPRSGRHLPGEDTYTLRLSPRAQAAAARDFAGISPQDRSADRPWIARPLSLADGAGQPADYATALEIPARLVMSPIAGEPVRWQARPRSFAHPGMRREVWSVRLDGAKLRAIFTPDAQALQDCAPPAAFPECTPCRVAPERYQIAPFNPPRPFAGKTAVCEFRTTLDARDRHELVVLSSINGLRALCGSAQVACETASSGRYVALPIDAPRLQLTSLGASFRYQARWDPPAADGHAGADGALSVMRYDQHAQLGRDIDCRVEYKGFLFPLGHPAILVKMTERRFCLEVSASGQLQMVARLVQRFFIRVPRFERPFPAIGQPNGNRLWGHASILMDEYETPDLQDPTHVDSSFAKLGQSAFTPRTLCGDLVEFDFGEPATSSGYGAPLVWVDNNVAHSARLLKLVMEEWRKRVFPLLGASVDRLPPAPAIGMATVKSGRLPFVAGMSSDHTELEVDRIVLDVQNRLDVQSGNTFFADPDDDSAFRLAQYDQYVGESDYTGCPGNYQRFSWFAWGVTAQMEAQRQPPFYPVRRRSRVRLGKLAVLDGRTAPAYLLDYDALYAEAGFDPARNAGQVFARFAGVAPTLDFSGDTSRSGGFANPSTALVFYSAKRGPLGGRLEDLVALASGAYTPVGESSALPCAAPLHTATNRVAGRTVTTVTRHSAHAEQLVPEEFFSAFLGQAMLLGVVRIVDILHAAMAAAGDMIPTINTEELFNLVEDNLRPIFASLEELVDRANAGLASDVPPAVAARLAPAMQAVKEDLQALRDELGQRPADGVRLLAVANRFGKDVGALLRTMEGVAREPLLFLPHEERQVFEMLKKLFETLRDKDLRALMLAHLQTALKEFIEARLAAELDALLRAIERDPRLQALRRRAEAMLARLNALRAELEQMRDDALATIGRAFDELVSLARQLQTLRAVLEAQAQELVDGIEQAATEFTAACRGVTAAQVDVLRRLAADAYGQVDATLAALEAGVPADLRGAAAPPMAQARRAAAAFNASVDDQLTRLEALVQGASLRRADARQAAAGLAQAADYVLRIPELALRQLARVAEMLDALLGFARVLDTDDAAVTAFCMQKLAPLVRAYGSILDGLRGQVAGGTRAAALDAALAGMKAGAARLEAVAARLPQPRFTVVREFLVGVATQLRDSVDGVEQACAGLLADSAASLFDTGAACAGAGAAIGARARDIQAAAAAPLARLQEAAQELAQLQASIGGLERAAQDAIGAVAAAAAGALARADAGLAQAEAELNNNVVKPIADQLKALPSKTVGGVKISDYFSRELRDAVAELQGVLKQGFTLRKPERSDIEAALRRLFTLLAESLSLEGVGRLVDVQKIMSEIQDMLGIPTRVRISYDWSTPVHSFPEGSNAIFAPVGDGRLEIHATVEAGLQGGPRTSMQATLSPFDIHLFGSEATRFLTVRMDKLELTLPPGGKLECRTKVLKVTPGKALGFVSNLAKMLGLDSNFTIIPTFNGIFVSYAYASEYQLLGGFVLQNIAFSIGATLPFDNSPVRVEVKLSDKLKPFLISAGIYGGGGFFRIQTRADTIEVLEASFEYGFVGGFGYGVLSGSGRVTAGIYIRLGGKDAMIEGFFCAMGEVNIASLFRAGAALRVSLGYQPGSGQMAGVAEYTFSFSIGWFDYEYGVQVQYLKDGDAQGAGNNRIAAMAAAGLPAPAAPGAGSVPGKLLPLTPLQWQELWDAYAPAPPNGEGLHSACAPFCTAT